MNACMYAHHLLLLTQFVPTGQALVNRPFQLLLQVQMSTGATVSRADVALFLEESIRECAQESSRCQSRAP